MKKNLKIIYIFKKVTVIDKSTKLLVTNKYCKFTKIIKIVLIKLP